MVARLREELCIEATTPIIGLIEHGYAQCCWKYSPEEGIGDPVARLYRAIVPSNVRRRDMQATIDADRGQQAGLEGQTHQSIAKDTDDDDSSDVLVLDEDPPSGTEVQQRGYPEQLKTPLEEAQQREEFSTETLDHTAFFKGRKWKRRADCTAYIKEINLKHGNRQVANHVTAMHGMQGYNIRCTSPECKYFLLIRKKRTMDPADSFFWIDAKRSNMCHDATVCESRAKATTSFLLQNKSFRSLVETMESDDVGGSGRGDRLTAKELQAKLEMEYDISATLDVIYDARQQIELGSWQDYKNSFKVLPSWMSEYVKLNKGSVFVAEPPLPEVPDDSKVVFRRTFFANGTVLHLVQQCGLRLLGQVTVMQAMLLLPLAPGR